MSTYLTATGGDPQQAVELYGWNARVSAALMLPAHFAEVTTRNAVADALTEVYGPRWPWEATFERSLPEQRGPGYNARRDLIEVRRREQTTGKVIAELRFAFWQAMFTARHDVRLWIPHIATQFPAAAHEPKRLRARVYSDLDTIRQLRNRIAHHEPIFARDLHTDLGRMLDLIRLRSPATAAWVRDMEDATATLYERP